MLHLYASPAALYLPSPLVVVMPSRFHYPTLVPGVFGNSFFQQSGHRRIQYLSCAIVFLPQSVHTPMLPVALCFFFI